MQAQSVPSQPPLAASTAPVEEYDDFVEESGMLAGVREIPAWAVSFGVHLLIGMALWSFTYSLGGDVEVPLDAQLVDVPDIESYKFDATVVDQVGNDSPINTLSPSQNAAQHVGREPQKEIEQRLEEANIPLNQQITDTIENPHESEFAATFDTHGSTEHPGGVEGAIDRLTYEIAGSLREKKTLVIWLFDASLSLKKRRETIADRFENVYKQLDMLKVNPDRALKTAVASYGGETKIITEEPVDDVSQIVQSVRDIKPDESGKEFVFSAVNTVATKWLSYRTKMRRNVVIIIVTDERGDDYDQMETTIAKLRRYGIKTYVVGNAAVFGRENGVVDYTDDTGYTWRDLPVEQGPETVAPERLKLAFWNGNSRDLEYMSASFGPYALTRLASETGGLYLVAGQTKLNFDPEIMREYQPDYRPIRDYDKQLKTNAAKGALVAAAVKTRAEDLPRPKMVFAAPNDTVLRQQITEAQKPLAVLDYKLNEMLSMLEVGVKSRDKLDTPRWRASFDLALGRLLAMRVRAYGYNATLAQMKAQPKSFKKKGSNQWRLRPARDVNAGPQVDKWAKEAVKLLSGVIDEHPGTPWALLAQRELEQPLGWEWVEGTMPTSMNGRGQGNDKNAVQLADDEAKKKAEMMKKKAAQRKPPVL